MFHLGARFRYFDSIYDPVLLSNLYCNGTKSSLLECNQQSCYVISCTHSNDAGVICEHKSYSYSSWCHYLYI